MKNKIKYYRRKKRISFILTILGILIIFSALLLFQNESYEVPCYDRFSNVIQGQTCINNNLNNWGSIFVILGILISFWNFWDYVIYNLELQDNIVENKLKGDKK